MFKTTSFLWSVAAIGAASAGLFLGSNYDAHSDISKFNALLSQHERVPGQLIVKVKPEMLQANLAEVFDAGRFRIAAIQPFETDKSLYTVELSGDDQTAQFLEASTSNPAIVYAEPNYILRTVDAPDSDPAENIPQLEDFSKLWGMKNVGQKDAEGTDGVVGADIGATKAWAITTGNKDITVAVIDTGVDYSHAELKDNIFANAGEIAGNGIDDDANGFIDDTRGWNFAQKSTNDPMDDNKHGTHCSGTIGGSGAGGKIKGVNWTTSIMPIKFLTGSGSGSLADAVKAIQYATLMNVKIMSNSWGGGGYTQTMFDAIKAARDKGILFIAAAGNDGDNADSTPHYPAGYQLDNVIAVAASTNRDGLAKFSTYGKRTVHIAAPGHKIYSSVPASKGNYDTFSGTSMATPHVAGAAALLWGANTGMTYLEIKDRLLRSRDYLPALSRKVASGGRLNIYNALMGIYPPSPEPTEEQWRDVPLAAPIESAHPYENSKTQDFVVEAPAGAKYMRVVFSKVDLEDRYDTIKIIDATGAEAETITGTRENAVTGFVEGAKLTIRFKADSSNVKWGFAVGKVQVVY